MCYDPSPLMTFYARHLPHWQPLERTIFLTWRLHGSLPPDMAEQFRQRQKSSPGKYFVDIDRVLDRAGMGASWLNDSRVAECVIAAIRRGDKELGQYWLRAFVIMPNHVHLLVDPHVPVERITKGLKGAAAREANLILDRTEQPF